MVWFLEDTFLLGRQFLGSEAVKFTDDHTEIPVFCVALYLFFIFQVPALLSNPLPLRALNAAWNLALAIFSIAGAIIMIPHLLGYVYHNGFLRSMCDPVGWYYDGTPGMWTFLFIYSKIPELLDTVFLVLQKKEVIFLHWFHHITVLLYCWHAYANHIPPGIWFATMNYTVHSVMYSYYFAGLIGFRKFFKPIAPLITTLQIVQMMVGMGVIVTAYTTYLEDQNQCAVNSANMKMGLAMYTSYFVLFVLLFHNLYIRRSGRSGKGAGVTTAGCPDIAESQHISDGSGFFHGQRLQGANEKGPKSSVQSKKVD